MSIFLVATLLALTFRSSLCCKSNDAAIEKFKDFASNYNKTYASTAEFDKRFKIFAEKLKEIDKLNKEAKGLTTFGINEFSDWTWDEFKQQRLIALPHITDLPPENFTTPKPPLARRPHTVDWSSTMPPVKHQGGCGSCWAFAVTAVYESQLTRQGIRESLSEQELVDCSSAGNCSGGFPHLAFDYAVKNGLHTESSYPYRGNDGQCRPHGSPMRKLSGYKWLSQNEEEMSWTVSDVGPIVVAFNVSRTFQMYRGGVFSDTGCKDCDAGHGVAVVGYGVENGQPYWIAKNSWGANWGERGFFRVARGINWCGLASYALSAWIDR